jgi:uncharacterized protein with HEPN domain
MKSPATAPPFMTTEARKRLHDIRLAAEALCRFTDGKTVVDFQRDEILQAALERKLEIIGEAFVQLRVEDAATAEKFPDLRQIVGMRNRLVHGYYDTRNSYSSALA